jgi:hypothetical protein
MSNDLIADLESLDRRWPGLFDVWRAMNGHGELADGYGRVMEVEIRMVEDPEFAQGVEAVAKAVAQMLAQDDPTYAEWLGRNGFIHKGLIDMKAKIIECESILKSVDSSREEIEKAVMGLKEVRAASQKYAVAREAGLVRGAAMIKEKN